MGDSLKYHASKLLSELKHPPQPTVHWFFSDENSFCQDQMESSQNMHCLALSPQEVRILMKTKLPVHIMVFGVVTCDSDVMHRPSWPQNQHSDLHQVSGEVTADLDREGSWWKALHTARCSYDMPQK